MPGHRPTNGTTKPLTGSRTGLTLLGTSETSHSQRHAVALAPNLWTGLSGTSTVPLSSRHA